jgi:[ribosomal protein S18]-alanine N-acetyltransferase
VSSRLAVQSDAVALATIHAACFDVAWSVATMSEFIEAGAVTVTGEPATGFLITSHVLDEAEIIMVAVHPSVRQNGLAKQLIATKLAQLAEAGTKRVFLEVAEDNVAAQRLYEKLGFVQIGSRKAYYTRHTGVAVDALVLSCDLIGNPFVDER